ncbi:MAG: argininosuccinate lyase [Acidobacteriota bacterium]|nr:argininosuccinate lyase [Acidobacteriota bacterium]
MRFDAEYVACVLNDNFEDAVAQFLAPLMRIHYAHLVMLTEQGIVPVADARAIRDALDGISGKSLENVCYDGTCEDLFFYVERLVVQACGEEAAGRLHTARSRNDIDMTMYRMQQREMILALLDGSARLRGVLLDLAGAHTETVFAAHTHTQPAQPSTIAHYLLAVVEQLERDTVRLRAAYASTNRNPLGACAITGTGFPIDRGRTTKLLGFDAATGNTYGSIATVDYLLESVSAAAVLLAGLGRVLQDLLLWCTSEFGYLRLSDGFVQGSSIMPQKRNPVALEHARAIASKALGQSHAVVLAVHNTPFGDIVDTEDDLQPLVASMFRDANRAVRLVAAALASAEFDRARLAGRAEAGWITATELADTLARDHAVPFKTSHRAAVAFVAECEKRPDEPRSSVLRAVCLALLGRPVEYDEPALARLLSPRHFVAVRTTPGGPAPAETSRAISASRGLLTSDTAWQEDARLKLSRADELLRTTSADL